MFKKIILSLSIVMILSCAALAQDQYIKLYCPTYLTWPGFESFVAVRNTTGSEVNVFPAFAFDGDYWATYWMINIPAHETVLFSVDEYLETSACQSGIIGIELGYQGDAGAVMASTVVIFGNLSFQVPFRNATLNTARTLHSSLCLGGDYTDYVFVMNTTADELMVTPVFYSDGTGTPGLNIGLEPYQPAIVDASSSQAAGCIGGMDLYSNGGAGSIVAVNIAANLLVGNCFVEEMLPGVESFVPPSYNLFVANGLSYTLSAINTETGHIDEIFAETGDVPNHLVIRNDLVYCVNSMSNNVQAISPATGDVTAEIDLGVGTNPWAIAFASDTKAYVTGYLTNDVAVIDLENNQVLGTIPLSSSARSPEGLCIADGKLYVTSINYNNDTWTYGKGVVTIIDVNTDMIIKTIETTQVNPQVAVSDNQGEVYVLCTGDWFSEFGVVDVIDTKTDEIVYSLSIGGSPASMEIAPNGYAYIGDAASPNIYKIDIVDNIVLRDSSDPLQFGTENSSVSGLVSSENFYLYISSFGDDYVYIMDWRTDSMIRMSYHVGDGPGALAFRE
ncbi:MAG: YncE family protein [Candidatus Coatesbacteria bacterium]|nr:YncE family protein [Candidatus Coatesbacteria bacterium]